MTKPLPKWVMIRYSKLWNKNRSSPFTFTEAKKILKEDERMIALVLSHLKKVGWLNSKRNPMDARIAIYQLESPENAVRRMK